MKCKICGTELRAELAITGSGWIIFHECIISGNTEQEVMEKYQKICASAHNSDYAQCTHEWELIEGNPVVVNTDICLKCHAVRAHSA